jgi:competence protein ComEA
MSEGAKWQLLGVTVVVGLLAFGAVRLLGSGGGTQPEPVRVSQSDPGRARSEPARSRGPQLVVHVAGAVRRPGVYGVPDGSRVAAAIARAGGPARGADLTAVNLAARVADGQQVIVPAGRGPGVGGASAAGGGGPLSLSTATVEQLDALDGIGETIARRIVEYRTKHGGLSSVDQLAEVDGIGEKRLEALRSELGP